jgi:uncharacterized protein YbbC (DUF1343 family)
MSSKYCRILKKAIPPSFSENGLGANKKRVFISAHFLLMLTVWACTSQGQPTVMQTGADQMPAVLQALQGKRVALMVNQTSRVGKAHLVDSLQASGISIVKIFAVEHGFRGQADAGEVVKNSTDAQTGLAIVSLYGSNKKPSAQHLSDVDIVVFDIQDVGARFYTYISSLHYLMEACAENNKPLMILDRPNPHGGYIDGPILQKEFKSFVGMHPIPVVHGMTIGEYGQMINGEGWLTGGLSCPLEIIKLKNWKHTDAYSLPVRPSPNLPNDQSIALYPSTCFFEGTALSVGRGTQHPFEWVGHPDLKQYKFQFTPISIAGMAKQPPLENQVCYGLDLSQAKTKQQLDLSYLLELYQAFPQKAKFFLKYFNTLAGNSELQEQIKRGHSEAVIRASWQPGLQAFQKTRAKYLLYP